MLLLSLLFMGLDCFLGAPTCREVYKMPQSTLKALSDRGTVILEAAMTSALSALDHASSERSRAEASCRGCVSCLFQDCGQQSGSCSSPANALSEPSCDVISKAQKLQDKAERSWVLSQACAYYQHRCSPGDLDKESCIRIMGESCSARVLQCSLLNTMQNLEPDTQTSAQAVCGQRLSRVRNMTQPHPRIVGGAIASPGSWPWLVNLQLYGDLMCGGVLVDSSWVVTAAHCFAMNHQESDWTAVMGDYDVTKTDPGEQILKINRIIPHPKFNIKTFNNDIALVELAFPVVLTDHVTPVCLPSGTEPPPGTPCLLAGWGSLYEDGPPANVVMEAMAPILPQSICKNAHIKEVITNTMLCAGYLSGGIDSCKGDSGGPLIYQDRISGRFQLHGITSWGIGCGEKGKPGVYTRVSAFSDWIQAERQKSFRSHEPTCVELLKTTEMSEEQQRSEFSSSCDFYSLNCPSGQTDSACSHMAEDKCLTRFKKCQLRSFLQTLLDLLQRAEDYIRDKVDLTFFTQTLPQLVEHIYSVAVNHTRQRRDLDLTYSLTQIAEQLGGAMLPEKQGPSPDPPALFREVGPYVDDWEKYLTSLAEDLDEQHTDSYTNNSSTPPRQEDRKLFLQADDSSVQQLDEDYQSVISALCSRLDSKAAPPILHMDTESPTTPPSPSPFAGTSLHTSPSSSTSSQISQEFSSLSPAVMNDLQKFRTRGRSVTGDMTQATGTLSDRDASPDVTQRATLDNLAFVENGKVMAFPLAVQPTTSMQPVTEGDYVITTADPRRTVQTVKHSILHRKHRSLLHKRQIPGASGKICPGVKESSQRVSQVRDSYHWVLGIPNKNLRMNFQEVLVDLSSKNDQSLYEARVRAVVGGKPLTFYSLVGLENESFYRSMPRIIALALEALKT
ncbi:hypothetical protein LDENG_00227550 [Lucifuga dentata]|nr:hypothetical protein LDENG_00227550 [Lucifuga dentata]